MNKRERQNTLLSLIGSMSIASQSELAERLTELGFHVTQASVSRDLDELGVVKLDGRYTLPPRTTSETGFGAVTFDISGDSLIVGRCSPGLASAITVRIDAVEIPEIVGTIAGDDTIFIAVKDAASQSEVLEKLAEMFG